MSVKKSIVYVDGTDVMSQGHELSREEIADIKKEYCAELRCVSHTRRTYHRGLRRVTEVIFEYKFGSSQSGKP